MLVSISRSSFSFVHTSFMFMHMLLILYLEAMPSLWLSCESFVLMLSQRSNGWISEYSSDSQGLTSIMFFTAYVLYTYVDVDVQAATTTMMLQRAHRDTLASTAIEIPFSLYSTFVIEEEFGFNKQTIWVRARSMQHQAIIVIIPHTHPIESSIAGLLHGHYQGPGRHHRDRVSGHHLHHQDHRLGRRVLLDLYAIDRAVCDRQQALALTVSRCVRASMLARYRCVGLLDVRHLGVGDHLSDLHCAVVQQVHAAT